MFASGMDTLVGTNVHANFKLTQTKNEPIILFDPSGTFLDSVITKPAQSNHSRGRKTDGNSLWSLFTTPTPKLSNTGDDLEYTSKPLLSLNA